MSSRGNSFLKRFKTEKTQRNLLLGWKPSNKTPTHRNQLSNRSPAHRDMCQKIQLKQKDDYLIKCLNHPMKKATFQPKQSLKQAYCQQCSIKFVKHNIRMIRISEESLYLRTLFEAQIQKVSNYQQQAKQMIERYFDAQRQTLRLSFIRAKQSQESHVKIPSFKIKVFQHSEFTSKIKQIFGTIHLKSVEFIHKYRIPLQDNLKIEGHQRNPTYQTNLLTQYQSILNKQNNDDSNVPKINGGLEYKLKKLPNRQGPTQKYACLK